LVLGATGSIGSAIARRLAADGFDIYAVSRGHHHPSKADQISGNQIYGDLTDPNFICALAQKAAIPHVLVHSIGRYCSSIPPSTDDAEAVMRTNLGSVLDVLKTFVPMMAGNGRGRIILIGSIAAWRGSRCKPYAESKMALLTLASERCAELARDGITINTLLPGPVDGPFFRASSDAVRREQFLEAIPMGRYALAEEVAGTVAFLASPDAAYISGATIPISGGLI
jgi:3-oxoacyl-[acyl-carrier protein] reductase